MGGGAATMVAEETAAQPDQQGDRENLNVAEGQKQLEVSSYYKLVVINVCVSYI